MQMYTCQVFITGKKTRRYHNVNEYGIRRLIEWLRDNEPEAKYFNVRNKKDDSYIRREYIYPENYPKTR